MAASITFPLTAGSELFGLNNDEGRPVYVYENNERTEKPRTDEAGRPLYRFKALLKYSGDAAEEVSLFVPTQAPLGVMKPVRLEPSASLSIRPANEYGLALTVTGVIAGSGDSNKG